jgi:hypothetical protein
MAGRGLTSPGGYLGIALLASLITLGVMLLLFTESGASAMQIEVGDVLHQECDETARSHDICYRVVVQNTSTDDVTGTVTCTMTQPERGIATFEGGETKTETEPIGPSETAIVWLSVAPAVGAAEPDAPGVTCRPT